MSAGRHPPLAIARGAVREGLAALEGFAELVGSRRVGPRALERARSPMDEACASLASAIGALERGLVEAFDSDKPAADVARALCEHIAARVKTITQAIAADGPLENARKRLALEATIRERGAEIKGAITLCDLLAASTTPLPVELDLVDALEHRFTKHTSETTTLKLFVDAPTRTPMHVDPQVLAGLVELGAGLAAKGAASAVRLAVRSTGGALVLRIAEVPRGAALPKTSLIVPQSAELPFTADTARAAARRAGLRFELDAATGAVSITSEVSPGPC